MQNAKEHHAHEISTASNSRQQCVQSTISNATDNLQQTTNQSQNDHNTMQQTNAQQTAQHNNKHRDKSGDQRSWCQWGGGQLARRMMWWAVCQQWARLVWCSEAAVPSTAYCVHSWRMQQVSLCSRCWVLHCEISLLFELHCVGKWVYQWVGVWLIDVWRSYDTSGRTGLSRWLFWLYCQVGCII